MLLLLILLFTVLPMVEIALLVELGKGIGWLPTLLIALGTGVLGASLAKAQGLATLGRIRAQLAAGERPGDTLLDGVLILLAGAVLITPGVLTDAFGFALLVPPIRTVVKPLIRSFFRRRHTAGSQTVVWTSTSGRFNPPNNQPDEPIIEGDIVQGEIVDTEVIDIQTNPIRDESKPNGPS